MNDLIRRSDAIEACAYETFECYEARKAIRNLPSADRPRGEWIEQDDCWQCSNCGDEFVLEVDVKPIDAKMHYCPNCGADMREREGE